MCCAAPCLDCARQCGICSHQGEDCQQCEIMLSVSWIWHFQVSLTPLGPHADPGPACGLENHKHTAAHCFTVGQHILLDL